MRHQRRSPEANALAKRNDAIEIGLANARKNANAFKILLLGAGESGKSTVLKQMRLIHGQKFTEHERAQYAKVIWSDTVLSIQTLLKQAGTLGIPLDCADPGSDLHRYRELLLAVDPMQAWDEETNDYVIEHSKRSKKVVHQLDGGYVNEDAADDERGELGQLLGQARREVSKAEVAEAIAALWARDRGLRAVLERSNEFHLEVNATHFFSNVHAYASDDYKATDTDILTGRIKTTGISETVFDIQGMRFRMFDVGGQRSERRKWIHCFDNVTAVLFVAAANEYDEVLFEDRSVNRMLETLQLFQSICNSRWFQGTPIILFLNKIDVLERKLLRPGSRFTEYFPDYDRDPKDSRQVLAYLRDQFVRLNQNPHRQVYVHYTCATDTASMIFVMQAVTDMILEKNMTMTGII
ncbi:guanine nucleotide-binding protein alpha-1 subunit [Trichomonascus vanleenenianus]|uniref:guanine nucleotide-binding protein subunit alpha n=1 Tax=Trichomonascus vanleenenianus TaxID=2268995 RepID=UPI003ECA544F